LRKTYLYFFKFFLHVVNMAEKWVAVWDSSKCLQCGLCVGVCPVNAMRLTERGIEIDVEKCTGCGICVKGCPVAALQLKKIVLDGGAHEE